MDKLAVFPALLSIWLLYRNGNPREVFLIFFIPVLTLIPAYYESKLVDGLPEVSFWSSALLPVLVYWFIKESHSDYRFHLVDVIILLHIVAIFYGQFEATGYKDAQKQIYRDILQRLMPFLLIRLWFSDPVFRLRFLKMVVALASGLVVVMIIESKWFINLADFWLRKIWPVSVAWDGVMQRGGFKRAAASFAHPISAGYFYAMVFPLAVWLVREKAWKSERIGMLMVVATGLGVLLSVSRAPILGMVLAGGILFFGWSRIKSVSILVGAMLMVLAATLIIPVFISYVSISRAEARTKDQENAAYRKEMLDNYFTVIAEKPLWGYGRYTYPVVNRQVSIDNEYLFMALTSGLVPLSLYGLFILIVPVLLAVFLIRSDDHSPDTRLAWAILAGWISAVFTQATVYAGNQTIHYFYMLAGMAVALVTPPVSSIPAWTSIRLAGVNHENRLCRTL